MASGGDAYMNGSKGARYVKWFGANNAARESTVKAHFASLKDAFATKPVTVDCGCKKTYYAYVYPTQPYVIYVCKAFWTAPMTGTDSKGGTLVHEMSHFNVVAGTDDWVYGQSGAASLAISDPIEGDRQRRLARVFRREHPGAAVSGVTCPCGQTSLKRARPG